MNARKGMTTCGEISIESRKPEFKHTVKCYEHELKVLENKKYKMCDFNIEKERAIEARRSELVVLEKENRKFQGIESSREQKVLVANEDKVNWEGTEKIISSIEL